MRRQRMGAGMSGGINWAWIEAAFVGRGQAVVKGQAAATMDRGTSNNGAAEEVV